MNVTRGASRAYVIVGVLALFLIGLVVFWVEPGPMSIDEVTYHRMTRDLHRGNGFFIENGYEELRSQELESLFILRTDTGHLTAQYPYGSTVLALPFYAAFGIRGPFLLNALACALCLLLCHRIARQLGRDAVASAAAPALLACTFFIEYALASWPHMTTAACQLAAFSLAVAAHQAGGNNRRADVLCIAAGLLVGIGMTLRFDAVFSLPVIAAPFFFSSPTRFRTLIAIALGTIPGIVFIVWTNYVRWDALSPLSYGPKNASGASHLRFGIAIVAATGAVWLATRPTVIASIKRAKRPALLAALVVGAVAVAAFHAQLRQLVTHLILTVQGVFSLIVDLRYRPLAAQVLDHSTALTFGTGFKKALLQSAPFLVLSVLPLRRFRRHEDRWLIVTPLILLGYFGAQYGWHGGTGVNLRYALIALPFLCILSAEHIRDVATAAGRRWLAVAGATVTGTVAAYFVLMPAVLSAAHEQFVLTTPIALALLLAIAFIAWQRNGTRGRVIAAMILAALAIGWSLASAIDDARWSRDRRGSHQRTTECISEQITDDALLFAEIPDPTYGAIEYRPHVRIAIPARDRFASARALVDWHLRNDRRVFGALGPHSWNQLLQYGVLDDFTVDQILITGPYILAEIRPPTPGEPRYGATSIEVPFDVFSLPRCGPDKRFVPPYYMPDNEVRIQLPRMVPP